MINPTYTVCSLQFYKEPPTKKLVGNIPPHPTGMGGGSAGSFALCFSGIPFVGVISVGHPQFLLQTRQSPVFTRTHVMNVRILVESDLIE